MDNPKGVEIDHVREKLVELVDDYTDPLSVKDIHKPDFAEKFADHLIAHGVTVLTADEQRNTYTVQEIEELQGEAYDLGADSVLHSRFGLSWDDAAGLRKEVARLQAAAKWIPVMERMPEASGCYLCYWHGHTRVLSYWQSHERFEFNGRKMDVTHWMPLPKLPKGE